MPEGAESLEGNTGRLEGTRSLDDRRAGGGGGGGGGGREL